MIAIRRILGAIALLIAISLPAGAQVNAEQCLVIGRNVLSMEDYMLSIQYFNQAIKAKPYLPDPYFFRGLAKLYLEDYKGAEEDCSLAIERNNYKTESYKVRGFARQYLGKDSLAIEDYNVGLRYNPQDKYFLYYKAVAETQLHRDSAADATFSCLLRLYPGFDDGYSARAHLRVQQKDTVAALEDLSRAIKIMPSSLQPYLLRSEIQARTGKWTEAAADMDEAIRLSPQEADFYVNRAYLRYNLDDFFGAMSDYNYALELEPYNTAALFNRALLRYEVKDLDKSATDLESVLRIDPSNFHAKYNLGLIDLERGRNREALEAFRDIARRYPRFYQAYYAMAEAWRNLGDMKKAYQKANYAEELVKKYVRNPETNRLDRPTIAAGKTNSDRPRTGDEEESETEVMERFNQLVTISANATAQLSYNEKIKGRVQDRDIQVDPEPTYALSFYDSPVTLRSLSNYFRELDDFNQRGYISEKLYLAPGSITPTDEERISALFAKAAYYNGLMEQGSARPADLLALGVVQSMLKNYPAAIEALDKAIGLNPRFAVAYMARAYVRNADATSRGSSVSGNDAAEGDAQLTMRTASRELAGVIADYDAALAINPRLVFAWFNKGNLYYEQRDYTSAMQCYAEALRIDPDFGAALFNRGICYLQMGNKRQAFVDLSKAGELGVIPSYNLLKRMK